MANPLKLLFIGGILGTLAWGALEYQRDNKQSPATPKDNAQTAIPDLKLPQIEIRPLHDFSETVYRPLFFADRKLPEPEAVKVSDKTAANKNQGKLPRLRLSAILIDSDKRSAVIEVLGTGKSRRLDIDQTISGWKLVEIKDQAIVMRSGSRKHQFELLDFSKPQVNGLRKQAPTLPLRPPFKREPSQAQMPAAPDKAMSK